MNNSSCVTSTRNSILHYQHTTSKANFNKKKTPKRHYHLQTRSILIPTTSQPEDNPSDIIRIACFHLHEACPVSVKTVRPRSQKQQKRRWQSAIVHTAISAERIFFPLRRFRENGEFFPLSNNAHYWLTSWIMETNLTELRTACSRRVGRNWGRFRIRSVGVWLEMRYQILWWIYEVSLSL